MRRGPTCTGQFTPRLAPLGSKSATGEKTHLKYGLLLGELGHAPPVEYKQLHTLANPPAKHLESSSNT